MKEWMLRPIRRYNDFEGRSRRKEYWLFAVFTYTILIPGFLLGEALAPVIGNLAFVPIALFALATLVPSLAVAVRRFHDQDKSGWFLLLAAIPYVGGVILIVFMCLEGTRGPNRFGPDPKAGEVDQIFS